MGNKSSSYTEIFNLQEGIPERNVGKIIGVYLDYSQFPLGGVIGISSNSVEVFNAVNGTKIGDFSAPAEITCADFNPVQRVLAVGYSDGKVRILNPSNLTMVNILHYDPKQLQTTAVTSVNCRLSGRVVVGYSNGITKEFKFTDQTSFNVFLTVDLSPSEEKPETSLPITQIEVAEHDNLVFLLQNGQQRCSVRTYQSGSSASRVTMSCLHPISSMQVLERYKAVVALAANNKITVFNYMDGEQIINFTLAIPGLTENNTVCSSFALNYTKQLRKVYEGGDEGSALDNTKGDLIYIGFNSGQILTARLALSMSMTNKIECTLIPYNLYRANVKIEQPKPSQPAITHLYIDPVTDHLLAASDGSIRVIERTVLRMLHPEKARTIDEEKKEKSESWTHKVGLSGWAPLEFITGGKKKPPLKQPVIQPEQKEAEKAKEEKKSIEKEKEMKKTQESRQIMERLAKYAQKVEETKEEPNLLPPAQNNEVKVKQEVKANPDQIEKQLDPDIKINI